MSDNEIKQDTAPAEAEESVEDKADAPSEADNSEENIDNNEVDYKAELEKEREIREKAEKALASDRYQASKERRETTEEADDPEESQPLTKAEVERMIAQGTQLSTKAVNEAKVEIIASTLSGSDAEKQLVIEKWRNRTFPSSLSLEDQVREAYVLANASRIVGQRDEIARALKSKESASKDSSTTYRASAKSGPESKISPDVKQVLNENNWKYNQSTGRYEKMSGSGRLMYRDAKTGRIQLEGEVPPQAR